MRSPNSTSLFKYVVSTTEEDEENVQRLSSLFLFLFLGIITLSLFIALYKVSQASALIEQRVARAVGEGAGRWQQQLVLEGRAESSKEKGAVLAARAES